MDQTDNSAVPVDRTPTFSSPEEATLYAALTSPVDDHSISRIVGAARGLRKLLSAEWRKGGVAADRRAELKAQITTLDDLLVQFKDPAATIRKATGGFNPQPRKVRRVKR